MFWQAGLLTAGWQPWWLEGLSIADVSCHPAVGNMAEDRGAWEIIRVVLLCVVWYLISSGNNVVGKTLLNEFPYPMTVTMVQLLSIASFSSPVLRLMGVRPRSDISWSYYKRLIIPLAFGKSVSSVLSHVSIWRVPVSYAHTGNFSSFHTCMLSPLTHLHVAFKKR